MDNFSLFDLLPEEEGEKYKAIKSTDWKWTMANDYPKEKNGLEVFSCFAILFLALLMVFGCTNNISAICLFEYSNNTIKHIFISCSLR